MPSVHSLLLLINVSIVKSRTALQDFLFKDILNNLEFLFLLQIVVFPITKKW